MIQKTITNLLKTPSNLTILTQLDTLHLKAIGWQLALKWRHHKDKDSREAQDIVDVLKKLRIEVRSRFTSS